MRVPDPSLLLLIPAYNEEARIEPVLRKYAAFFQQHYKGKFQLVVVLNGCRDNTLSVVQNAAKEFPSIEWMDFPAPIGKGGALIEGLKLAGQSEIIGYVDADGATGPEAVLKLIPHLEKADCVIGSRWLPGSVLLKAQPVFRQIISRCFHGIVEFLFWLHIKDTQCPCKLMHRRVVEKIHPTLRIADLAFDVNLLVSIKRAGFTIDEVPIEWTDVVGSKVTTSLFRSSTAMFLSVVRVWLINSPRFYRLLKPLRPLEGWVYSKLRAPAPLSANQEKKGEEGAGKSTKG
ncbi:MAG TPA: glycosyltransferase [Verrucomicrobiae bacterium]|nr:glycosyltransferase [Verrucomicrobiae bacterium]